MKEKSKYPKVFYEVKFQYTTYNRLYLVLHDGSQIEDKLKDLNLNLTFNLDEESFDFVINRDLILVHETNQLGFDELKESTQKSWFDLRDRHIERVFLKNLSPRN